MDETVEAGCHILMRIKYSSKVSAPNFVHIPKQTKSIQKFDKIRGCLEAVCARTACTTGHSKYFDPVHTP